MKVGQGIAQGTGILLFIVPLSENDLLGFLPLFRADVWVAHQLVGEIKGGFQVLVQSAWERGSVPDAKGKIRPQFIPFDLEVLETSPAPERSSILLA